MEMKGVMGGGLVVIDLEYEVVVVRNGEVGEGKEGGVVVVWVERGEIVEGRKGIDEVLVDGGRFDDFVVEDVEGEEVEVEREVGGVVELGMEIDELGVGIKWFKEILEWEGFEGDVVEVGFVVLIEGFDDEG